jgi:AcrR family transcriptional regulator
VTSVTQGKSERRRRMSAADRREAILDAALDEFAAAGFHETSLEGVAGRAGISKALIYEHFASKRDLHEALLGRYRHELLQRVIAALSITGSPEQRLKNGADAFLGFVEDNREPWKLMVRSPIEAGPAGGVGREQGEMAHAVAALVHGDVPEEMEAEQGPDEAKLRVEFFAQQLVGALRALANFWDDHRELPRQRLVQASMNFVFYGLDRNIRGERWEP